MADHNVLDVDRMMAVVEREVRAVFAGYEVVIEAPTNPHAPVDDATQVDQLFVPPPTLMALDVTPMSAQAAQLQFYAYVPHELHVSAGRHGLSVESWLEDESEVVDFVRVIAISIRDGSFREWISPLPADWN